MLIKIKAKAGSRKESVTEKAPDRLEICVREPAADGRANKKILEIVRSIYPGKAIRLVKGHHSPSKIVSVG